MSNSNIRGGAELQAFLSALPAKMEQNIMRAALRQGANVIKKAAQEQIASSGTTETGAMAKGLKVSTRARNGKVTASVKATGKHAHIAHWIEYGVAAHGVKKGAKRASGKYQEGNLHPGFTEKPFMRPALDNQKGAAIRAIGETIKKKLSAQGINSGGLDLDDE